MTASATFHDSNDLSEPEYVGSFIVARDYLSDIRRVFILSFNPTNFNLPLIWVDNQKIMANWSELKDIVIMLRTTKDSINPALFSEGRK